MSVVAISDVLPISKLYYNYYSIVFSILNNIFSDNHIFILIVITLCLPSYPV